MSFTPVSPAPNERFLAPFVIHGTATMSAAKLTAELEDCHGVVVAASPKDGAREIGNRWFLYLELDGVALNNGPYTLKFKDNNVPVGGLAIGGLRPRRQHRLWVPANPILIESPLEGGTAPSPVLIAHGIGNDSAAIETASLDRVDAALPTIPLHILKTNTNASNSWIVVAVIAASTTLRLRVTDASPSIDEVEFQTS